MTLVGWSSVPLFLRHFSESIDAWTSNGWRYGFSALVWLPVVIVALFRRNLPKGLWKAALIPSIVNAAGQVCFTWAHYRIDPAMLTFGLRTQLIFVAVGAWILFPKERAIIRTPGYLIGACMLLAGCAAVLLLDHGDTHGAATRPEAVAVTEAAMRGTSAGHWQGVWFAVASGLLFACYGLSVRKFMAGVNSVLAFAAICQFTALAQVVLMLMLGAGLGGKVLKLPVSQIELLLLSALIGIAIGHVFYYNSIARLGVAVTAGVLQLQPFLVALFSLSLFGEQLSGWQWVGGSVAVLGAMSMLWVQWQKTRNASAAQARAIEEPVAIAEGEGGA